MKRITALVLTILVVAGVVVANPYVGRWVGFLYYEEYEEMDYDETLVMIINDDDTMELFFVEDGEAFSYTYLDNAFLLRLEEDQDFGVILIDKISDSEIIVYPVESTISEIESEFGEHWDLFLELYRKVGEKYHMHKGPDRNIYAEAIERMSK